MSTSVGPTGRNLFEEIRRVSGLSLKGRYKRHKAKKWKWIGTSDVVASALHLLAANTTVSLSKGSKSSETPEAVSTPAFVDARDSEISLD
jgi:hypothetical protein|tara:strand:- start:161 stop:430 length:270 start_codon:yes stop_codon:yes gene_type:complete